MRRQKVTVYSAGERDSLADSPFAALGKHGGNSEDQIAETSEEESPAGMPFGVSRTRKGGWPIRLEKRAGGKSATVITTVEGDADALLKILKKKCSAGGVVRESTVEIQGDQQQVIQTYLDSLNT